MKRIWMICVTQVNKNPIAECECSKHYLVAENELCKNIPIKSFIITEKTILHRKEDQGLDCGTITAKSLVGFRNTCGILYLYFFILLFCYKNCNERRGRTFLLFIREIPVSNLGPEIGYADRGIS
jgi:hypothetical protein